MNFDYPKVMCKGRMKVTMHTRELKMTMACLPEPIFA